MRIDGIGKRNERKMIQGKNWNGEKEIGGEDLNGEVEMDGRGTRDK